MSLARPREPLPIVTAFLAEAVLSTCRDSEPQAIAAPIGTLSGICCIWVRHRCLTLGDMVRYAPRELLE